MTTGELRNLLLNFKPDVPVKVIGYYEGAEDEQILANIDSVSTESIGGVDICVLQLD